jgi:hypothetical protein
MRHEEEREVSEATREAEDREARTPHLADRPVTSEEEEVLDEEAVDEDVREHYREMTARGAQAKGEGRIP